MTGPLAVRYIKVEVLEKLKSDLQQYRRLAADRRTEIARLRAENRKLSFRLRCLLTEREAARLALQQ